MRTADLALDDTQVVVLRWIAAGCPDGVMPGHAHKVSAAALRSRGLIRTRGRGSAWRAELTDRGRAYLAAPAPPRRPTARGAGAAR